MRVERWLALSRPAGKNIFAGAVCTEEVKKRIVQQIKLRQ